MFRGVDPFVISVLFAVIPLVGTDTFAKPSLIAAISSTYYFETASVAFVGAPKPVILNP